MILLWDKVRYAEFVNSFPFNDLSTKVITRNWQHYYILQDMLLEKLDHTMIVLNVKLCLEIKSFSVHLASKSVTQLVCPQIQGCASSVQYFCTLSIYASDRVFVYGIYCKCRLVRVLLSDMDLSLHHSPL